MHLAHVLDEIGAANAAPEAATGHLDLVSASVDLA
jgi:hypothetical protein